MKVKVLLFWLCVTLINFTKFVRTVDLQNWEDFKTQFAKHYATPEEEQQRKKIYEQNLRRIAKHNEKFKKGEVSFDMGMNHFGDMTAEEFIKHHCSDCSKAALKHDLGEMLISMQGESSVKSLPPNIGTAPEFKNWTSEGAVTPIKNQDQPARCGSCWAFAVAGVIESHNFIHTGKLVRLSEQNLLDCVAKHLNISGHSCKGGTTHHPFHYVINNTGIATEESYPYTGKQGSCRYTDKNKGATIVGFKRSQGDENLLKSIVGLIGPVTSSIFSDRTLQFHRDGIYKNQKCKNASVNHAVIVVGYGTEQNEPYWLAKNSWGPNWGQGGYFKIRRGTNECGISKFNFYPVL